MADAVLFVLVAKQRKISFVCLVCHLVSEISGLCLPVFVIRKCSGLSPFVLFVCLF